MRGHEHYDLDQMERDIRKMFEETTARADGKPLDTINIWQEKTCDLLVAFMRWQMEMEMSGVEPQEHAKIVGVVLADLAHQVWVNFDHVDAKGRILEMILEGFASHTNQVMRRDAAGVPPDMSAPLNAVVSGRA